MEYKLLVDFQTTREAHDGRGLSAIAIDKFRLEAFSEAVAQALFEAVQAGMIQPTGLRLIGRLEVKGKHVNETAL